LKKVEKQYSHLYTFELRREFYLEASAKKDTYINFEELQEIYKLFGFKDGEGYTRRNTSYVYLNVYAYNGKFMYQIYYDPIKNKFIKGNTPHY
jgi:hypothetical protein